MIDWLDKNTAVLLPVLAIAAPVLLVSTLVFLVAWLHTRHLRREDGFDQQDAEADIRELELSLAEQTARLRIIRELHEVGVHSLSVMISQAEGVRFAAEQDPAAAVRLATVVADAARSTQADLRRVMTVVGEGDIGLESQTRIDAASELFTSMRAAGLDIIVEETGERFDLIPGAELAVMRILQQSLANSLKHGGEGTQATVILNWTIDGLRLLIDDDGARARERRAGLDPNRIARERGVSSDDKLSALTEQVLGAEITEMRERATLFGGVFNAYLVPGVGFSVAVAFPALRYHNGVHGVNLEG
ncbi:MAG: ATP-binding protein [Glaciihabitans sp.]|nr:ATP-binding protein [Glaciihabitans sp.]